MITRSHIRHGGAILVTVSGIAIVAMTISTACDKTKQRPCEPKRLTAADMWTEVSSFEEKVNRLIGEIDAVEKPHLFGEEDQVEFAEKILVIGETRSTEAIPVLIKNLAFLPSRHPRENTGDSSPRTYEFFPAAAALSRIGHPAIPALMEVIRSAPKKALERRIALWILFEMEANPDGGRNPIKVDEPTMHIVWARFEVLPHIAEHAIGEVSDFLSSHEDGWERPKL